MKRLSERQVREALLRGVTVPRSVNPRKLGPFLRVMAESERIFGAAWWEGAFRARYADEREAYDAVRVLGVHLEARRKWDQQKRRASMHAGMNRMRVTAKARRKAERAAKRDPWGTILGAAMGAVGSLGLLGRYLAVAMNATTALRGMRHGSTGTLQTTRPAAGKR